MDARMLGKHLFPKVVVSLKNIRDCRADNVFDS